MFEETMTINIQDIYEAAGSIGDIIVKTPCTRSQTLSEITGAEVILKFENHQFTASFKDRGALFKLLVRDLVNEILIIEESQIEAAVLLLLEVEKTVVEGAGAVGLAALLSNRQRFEGRKVGLILSGGNIDMLTLSSIIQRGLVRSCRLVRLRVGIPDVPGALAEVTRLLGENNANIVDIRHQRAFTNLSLRFADVEFVIQALGKKHIGHILEVLKEAKYEASIPEMERDETCKL